MARFVLARSVRFMPKWEPDDDPAVMAAGLYAALRDFDAGGVDEIFARLPAATDGLSPAIADRLRRAAAGRVVSCA